jgi:predicted DCC family thiol-disulfide oxidoreductase YuxK
MGKMVLLFDSGCKLCNSSIKFVTKGDKKQQINQIPLTSSEGAAIIAKHPSLQNINSIVFIANNQVFIESDAIIEIAKQLSFPYKFLAAGSIIPKKWRDLIYRWIAKNRYKWFGRVSL